MTTITIERELLERVSALLDEYDAEEFDSATVSDVRAALASPATAPEQCWCDEQGIGEPGVSCGDCPTRDYKAPATAPDELERLRKDAERYRWLRTCRVTQLPVSPFRYLLDGENLDHAIDAAMKGTP